MIIKFINQTSPPYSMLFFTLHIELQGPEGNSHHKLILKNDTQATYDTLQRIFGHCVKVNLPVITLRNQEKIFAIRIEEFPFGQIAKEDVRFSVLAKKIQKIIRRRKEKAEMELALKKIIIRYLENWNPN